jgi:hypothetical protein
MSFRCTLGAFLLALLTNNAHAQSGIVVRLVTNGEAIEGTIEATLTNEEGTSTVVTLQDNGEAPDVTKDDHRYSGGSMLSGNDFEVSLSTNGTNEEVGSVSWPADLSARDLIITQYEGIVTLETGSGLMPGSGGAVGSPPSAGGGGAATPPGDAATTGTPFGDAPARSPSASFPSPEADPSIQDDATLYIIGGILLLVLAGVTFFWFRSPAPVTSTETSTGHARVRTLPEPGILGDATPSLSDGTSIWVVPSANAEDFLHLMLQTLAQHHRVLLVTNSTTPAPLVHGGPVHLMKSPRAAHVADAARALAQDSGNPLAIVVHVGDTNPTLLNDIADLLPPEVGAVILAQNTYSGPEPTVQVSANDSGWTMVSGDSTINLSHTEWGIKVDRVSPEQPA